MTRFWEAHRRAIARLIPSEAWRVSMARFLEFALPIPVERALLLGGDAPDAVDLIHSRVEGVVVLSPDRAGLTELALACPHAQVLAARLGGGVPLPIKDEAFDVIFARFSLLSDGELEEALRILRPGGALTLIVPGEALEVRSLVDAIAPDGALSPAEAALAPELETLARALMAHRVTDVEVAARLSRLGLIGIRTVELLGGAFLMVKGRRSG